MVIYHKLNESSNLSCLLGTDTKKLLCSETFRHGDLKKCDRFNSIVHRFHIIGLVTFVILIFFQYPDTSSTLAVTPMTRSERITMREKIVKMFYHGYESYLNYAFPFYDEVKPLSCTGTNTWGGYQLTLIDALDTLAVLGNHTEFNRVAQYLIDNLNFDINTNVSVFETNIRVVGGLLAAHLFAHQTGFVQLPFSFINSDSESTAQSSKNLKTDNSENHNINRNKKNLNHEGWPCKGPLLDLAVDVARRLLPAFDTETGMPYGTVNLRYGVPNNETPISCTAGIGTFMIEFGALSRLTGDSIYEETALRALKSLHNARSQTTNLPGNHINVQDSVWTALDSSVGGSVDSFFESLAKSAALFRNRDLQEIFSVYLEALRKHTMKNDWWVSVRMDTGRLSLPVFQSLEAFWPGLLTLMGEIKQAQRSIYNYYHILRRFGFLPEFYDIPAGKPIEGHEGYPLRPEYAESLFYLYRATKDPQLLYIAATLIEAIEHSSRTECGYATVKNIVDHTIEDRMESFFLAETLKYLYLLFAEDVQNHPLWNDGTRGRLYKNPLTNETCIADAGGYVFNTEAHLIDSGLLDCCHKLHSSHNDVNQDGENEISDDINKFEDDSGVDQYDSKTYGTQQSSSKDIGNDELSGTANALNSLRPLLRCSAQTKQDIRLSLAGQYFSSTVSGT